MALLTDRTLATGVTLQDLIHIVIPTDLSQNPAGSSYKATIEQVGDALSGSSFNTYVTGGTYSAGTATFTNNNGGTFDVTGFTQPFTGNTSGDCITDLYVTNVYGCSPITVHDNIQSLTSSATGTTSFAFGFQTKAHGDYSTASGYETTASGIYSTAIGYQSRATGDLGYAEGYLTLASGSWASHAEGGETTASGDYSHSEGYQTTASGNYSHTEGSQTIASGSYSHAEGAGTTAIGNKSHAEGDSTITNGNSSHAEGVNTIAIGLGSHAEGYLTTASGNYSHAEGSGFKFSVIASGIASHAEGGKTTASGNYSHAEGLLNIATGSTSHAEGSATTAIGVGSHTEGSSTTAIGQNSHTEGQQTITKGLASHAEGLQTTAQGNYSHAEGQSTKANGIASHAEGKGNFAFGDASHAEGYQTTASSFYTHAEGWLTNCTGKAAHTEGRNTTASGPYSHSEGYGRVSSLLAFGDASHAEGDSTTANGNYSHAEGQLSVASGGVSHAEGTGTLAIGNSSHSQNILTTASGYATHAGGNNSIASGDTSFIHSKNSLVTGDRSVVLGGENITGTTDDTVYVPYFNIGNLGTTIANNKLGIDSNGNVVSAITYTDGNTIIGDGSLSQPLSVIGSNSTGNLLLTGGASYSNSGLTFDVSVLTYLIGGIQYTTSATTVTLSTGDTVNPRFDAIVADENEVVSVIEGTPDATPLTPAIGEDQVLVQYVLIGAGATTPNITTQYIYREGSTPDWTGSFAGGFGTTADFTYTGITPYQGSECTLATIGRYGGSRGVRWSTGTPVNRDDYLVLSFRVYLPSDLTAAGVTFFRIFAWDDNLQTNYIGWVNAHQYMDMSLTGTWQFVSIPTGLFNQNLSANSIGFLNFTLYKPPNTVLNPTEDIALDDIKLQTGYLPPLNSPTIDVLENDVAIGSTSKLNFIDGTNTTVVLTDDNVNNKIDVQVDLSFTGNTSGDCITDLYVTNIYGCSPITVYDNIQSVTSSATGTTSFAFGFETKAHGNYSHAEGRNTTASGNYSHAEGDFTTASGDYSHVEGSSNIAIGLTSHAEGNSTRSIGDASHAEGQNTTANGNYSHSEGYITTASGIYSHSEGGLTTASGYGSHVEGKSTIASGNYSHAEGLQTIASGNTSHAEGWLTTSIGIASHAEGFQTTATNQFSHAAGYGTIAYEDQQYVIGQFNNQVNANQKFIVGGGVNSGSRSNLFRVDNSGNVYGVGATYNSGADYAEYFESLSGNTLPYGTVVELTGNKIKICEIADNAIGVISAKPTIVGNCENGTSDEWVGKYETDIFGNFIMENQSIEVPIGIDISGNTIYETQIVEVKKLSDNYDPSLPYINRESRPEWNKVGLLGQIPVLKNQQIPSRWVKMKDLDDNVALYLVR